jgi:hypothetical protein
VAYAEVLWNLRQEDDIFKELKTTVSGADTVIFLTSCEAFVAKQKGPKPFVVVFVLC